MTAQRFRLSAVLGIRRYEFEKAAAELAEAERFRLKAQAVLAEARVGADRSRVELQERLREGMSANTLRFIEAGLSRNHDRLVEAKQSLYAAELLVTEIRNKVMETRRRVRALQRLETKHRNQLKEEAEHREQQQLDDVGQRKRGLYLVALILLVCSCLVVPARSAFAQEDEIASDDYGVTALLTEIRSRQSELDRRERELDDRERSIDELEGAAAKRIEELENIARTVEERIEAWEADNGKSVRKLAKIYAAMPPAQAAGLLEELEVGLATQIVAKMKDKQSAAVLSQISEARALSMSRRVAHPLSMEPATPGLPKER